MATLKELLAQRAALDEQISQTQSKERADALAQVKALMAEYDLSVADLGTRVPKGSKTPKESKVAAKYRNDATGETWSGRGLQPKWLKAAVADGASLDKFKI